METLFAQVFFHCLLKFRRFAFFRNVVIEKLHFNLQDPSLPRNLHFSI